jgi:uncharacterized protein YdhG (YjbR/CyaY superfamily)
MTNTIDAFITKYPSEVQKVLKQLKASIEEAAPGAEPSFGYGVPGYKTHGKPLVYFSAFKSHTGLYPTPSGIKAFKSKLSEYKVTTGAIQFPFSKPLPIGLIKQIVEFRVKENATKIKK